MCLLIILLFLLYIYNKYVLNIYLFINTQYILMYLLFKYIYIYIYIYMVVLLIY